MSNHWSFARRVGLIERRVLAIACLATACVCATQALAVTYIQGIDVYNGDGAVNWTTVKNAGYQFAFVKATEGVDFVDLSFTTNMSGANSAGIYVGPYHFCRIDSKNGVPFTSYDGNPFPVGSDPWLDATSEAVDFIHAIRPYYQQSGSTLYLPPVADVERYPDFGNATLNKNFISNWTQLFSDTVNKALGVRPLIYSSQSHANSNFTAAVAGAHRLWIAWWKGTGTTSPPLQSDTPNWPPWVFWQWTATGSVAGVPGAGANHDCDQDVFYGTLAQLAALKVKLVPGDYNHDGFVNAADYVVWRNSMGSTTNLAADGNSNDVIDNGDYTFWRSHFGQTFSGAGAGSGLESFPAVPEPCAICLLLSGGFVLMLARARS